MWDKGICPTRIHVIFFKYVSDIDILKKMKGWSNIEKICYKVELIYIYLNDQPQGVTDATGKSQQGTQESIGRAWM